MEIIQATNICTNFKSGINGNLNLTCTRKAFLLATMTIWTHISSFYTKSRTQVCHTNPEFRHKKISRTRFNKWTYKRQKKWFLSIIELCYKTQHHLNLQLLLLFLMCSNLTNPRSSSSCTNWELTFEANNSTLHVLWTATTLNLVQWTWDYSPRNYSSNSTTSMSKPLKKMCYNIRPPCLKVVKILDLTRYMRDGKQSQVRLEFKGRKNRKKKEIRQNLQHLK